MGASLLAWIVTGVLLIAVAAGWVLHWLWRRIWMGQRDAQSMHAEGADRLLDAELAQDAADAARRNSEAVRDLRIAELQETLETSESRLANARLRISQLEEVIARAGQHAD